MTDNKFFEFLKNKYPYEQKDTIYKFDIQSGDFGFFARFEMREEKPYCSISFIMYGNEEAYMGFVGEFEEGVYTVCQNFGNAKEICDVMDDGKGYLTAEEVKKIYNKDTDAVYNIWLRL